MGGRGADRSSASRLLGLLLLTCLGFVALYLSGQVTLLALLLGLLQVVFTLDPRSAEPPDDEQRIRQVCLALHQAQKQAWRAVTNRAHMHSFLAHEPGSGGAGRLFPPRVQAWPALADPALQPGLLQPGLVDRGAVGTAVTQLSASWRNLVIVGDEDVGKTVLMMLMLLEAERQRDTGVTAALPLRISLAGWPVADRALTLRAWVGRRIREDYPDLALPERTVEAVVNWLWDGTPGDVDRRTLFLDGIDEVEATEAERADLLRRALWEGERGAGPVVVACRPGSWQACAAAGGFADWQVLVVATPDDDDVRRYLGASPEWVDYLLAPGRRDDPVRRSLRLLQLVADTYTGPNPACPVPGWLSAPPADETGVLHSFWADIVAHVRWPGRNQPVPDPAERRDFEATVAWLVASGTFEEGSAWWQVPAAAAADPLLARAVRRARRARLRSVLCWAGAACAAGLAALMMMLVRGAVQGYPHADGGLGVPSGLRWVDVAAWSWTRPGDVFANPAYLALLSAVAMLAIVASLCLLGAEFEHPDGGQPQTIRLTAPSLRGLRSLGMPGWLVTTLGLWSAVGVVVAVGVDPALGLRLLGVAGFAWFLGAALAWLVSSARAVTDQTGGGSVELFERDRRATLLVACLGAGLAAAAAVGSHWVATTGFRGVPTVTAVIGMLTSLALFVGVGRGILLGADMGLTRVIRLRRGFGIGYAARLTALERAARGELETAGGDAVRMRWLELFGLPAHPEDASPGPDGVTLTAVVPTVGSRLQLRDATLKQFLEQIAPVAARPRTPPVPGPRRSRLARRVRAAVLTVGAIGMLTVATGSAATVIPRVPCGGFTDLQAARVALSPSSVRPSVWLENGQCVGFVVPGLQKWPGSRFDAPYGVNSDMESDVRAALATIGAANRKAVADSSEPVTVVFLAPLTRTGDDRAVNALWQLEGVASELTRVNDSGGPLRVRLVVANAGENFVSGAAVVRGLRRAFPDRPGHKGIDAVIGVAQSRASAREALLEFGGDVPIMAASVYGSQMRQGLGVDRPLDTFRSVAPSDATVAGPMVELALAQAGLPVQRQAPSGAAAAAPRLGLIYDPADFYFSVDLRGALLAALDRRDPTLAAGLVELELSEVNRQGAMDAAARTRAVATTICAPGNAGRIWLYAGRGNLWTALDHRLGCSPDVVGGPGAITAVAASRVERSDLRSSDNLRFLSLVAAAPGASAADVAALNDRTLGGAALLQAAPVHVPDRCAGARSVLGVAFDATTGHNTLGPGADPCAASAGSPILFCRFGTPEAGSPRCTPASASAPTEPKPTEPKPTEPKPTEPAKGLVQAIVQQPPNNPQPGLPLYDQPRRTTADALGTSLPWGTRVAVLCQVPRRPADQAHREAWAGVMVNPGQAGVSGTGFVRWRFVGQDRNVYLRFPGLTGALAQGTWSQAALPSTLPACPDRTALVALVDRG
jgi:hypothetical protein